MVTFIFEDNVKTPSSSLLKSSYNGANIEFSSGGGSHRITPLIDKHKRFNKDSVVIIFLDLPPNNEKTYFSYEKITDHILNNNYSSVYIIPIICIEYYILRLIMHRAYTKHNIKLNCLMDNLVKDFNYSYSTVQDVISNNKYVQESLEHLYKWLLINLVNNTRCMINAKRKDSYYGKFYLSDCDCDTKFCKISSCMQLTDKAEMFYTELPVFTIKDEVHKSLLNQLNIRIQETAISDVYNDVIDFFYKICKSMNIEMIHIFRFDYINRNDFVDKLYSNLTFSSDFTGPGIASISNVFQ